MKLLLGTHNPSKLSALRSLVETEKQIVAVSPKELGLYPDAPETGKTAVENAREKALAWHQASGLPVLAADSGLVFVDLPRDHPDQPGVHVRRMCDGRIMEDDEEMLAWYQALLHRHGGALSACWQDAYCLVLDERRMFVYESVNNRIFRMVETPCASRRPGWPLDSLSICPYNGRYDAEMTREERDAVYSSYSDAMKAEDERRRKWLHHALNDN